ncbi:hypothetical protein CY34DRAFT_565027 [Suillus luteus UH-Slu-Lm8-n1]|uniref:Uncharacterized protein n=1 Tax=Suillus luteus UH-Slu-Lm8-n1 TaxID=930992 RepID=A0A0D0ATW6_9AGAM|nr:hypothetical protein CY34DRAFT_565027 [Suillus luteus UH-Slu-Lm8-n1]
MIWHVRTRTSRGIDSPLQRERDMISATFSADPNDTLLHCSCRLSQSVGAISFLRIHLLYVSWNQFPHDA